MKCRHCKSSNTTLFLDLGSAPASNSFLTTESLNKPETWYPLRVKVCHECWLVQSEDFAHYSEFFSPDYVYFSSFSESWLRHAENYSLKMIERFSLNPKSFVVEIAANDGYLLKNFIHANIPCLGIEPTKSTANAAKAIGIPILEEFFGEKLGAQLAAEGKSADLTAANNVLAHVPDINDFIKGFAAILKPAGVATFEFPHLLNLIKLNQFDTIYHEHFSYLSLTAVQNIFNKNGLSIFDVEELETHGGSLRVFAQRKDTASKDISQNVLRLLKLEEQSGIKTKKYYAGFQEKVEKIKNELLLFLIQSKSSNKKVAAYGAAAKGNTLFNFAGVRKDLVEFVVDRNPTKVGRFLPGSRIPVLNVEQISAHKPDYILILPWNLKKEIYSQLKFISNWDGKCVVAIPHLEILS